MRTTLSSIATVTIATMISLVAVAEDKSKDEGIQFFESKIRPLLVEHCYKCHGPKKQEGSLRLDSLEAMEQGGDSGMAVVAGEPEQSLLLTAVSYENEDLEMPPDGRLSDREIKDLTHWIEIGAPYPETKGAPKTGVIDWNKAKQFWAFQPPADPAIPTVKNKSWPKSPLDYFILAKLEENGLNPAPPADAKTLIRRITFDLTGLPPTPEEVRAFQQESNRNPKSAIANLVDRLLESDQYGVRWARHWLDVARYADSNGLDENVAYGNAWRYRNYVINALNNDTPYDQFIIEQLAGDLLPAKDTATRHKQLIATGFLSLGPKVLAEVDETKMEMDIVDEQVDTVGRAFMAMTFGCARCHNHKFDPILTKDYYALAGIFKSTKTMEHFKKIARWWENPIATEEDKQRKADHEKKIAETKKTIESLVKTATEAAGKADEAAFADEAKTKLKTLRDELAALEKSIPELPTAIGVSESSVADVPIHVRGSHLTLGAVAPRGFPRVLSNAEPQQFPSDHSGRLELANWLASPEHPLTSRVMVNRVWRWHFGTGVVPSTDNFGKLGDRPTNGPLLDWLARKFIQDGWSIKQLHRTILLSATYQMSSQHDDRAAEVDPENRLQWRANIRRLEAEAIRDSMLSVAGMLDPSMGDSMLHVKNRAFLFDHTSKDETKYDSNRRSIYLPVVRNHLYDVFSLFDYSDASMINGNRTTSTVAPQALFMMNSRIVHDAARQLATNLVKNKTDSTERIQSLYWQAFGRPASDHEIARAEKYIDVFQKVVSAESDVETATWQSLCHTMISSNEFIYVK